MNWPSDDEISAMLALPEGYRGGRLKRSEIPLLVASISDWHPDISVGAASCYLREEFYTDKAFLDGESEKDLLVIVIKRCGPPICRHNEWLYRAHLKCRIATFFDGRVPRQLVLGKRPCSTSISPSPPSERATGRE